MKTRTLIATGLALAGALPLLAQSTDPSAPPGAGNTRQANPDSGARHSAEASMVIGSGGSGGSGFGGGGSGRGSGFAFNPAFNSPDIERVLKQVEEALQSSLGAAGAAARDAQDKAMKAARQALQQAQTARAAIRPWAHFGYGRQGPRDEPALIGSQPMEPAARLEWKEDLRVMDKLLRDEVKKANGGRPPRQAMGVSLGLSLQPQTESAPPAYLEDYGALFSYEASFPLMPAPQTAKPASPQRQTSTAWERARRELRSRTVTVSNGVTNVYEYQTTSDDSPATDFNTNQVHALVNGLLVMLDEAKNIRRLKDREWVTVTVAGADEAGQPARLTLKVSQADLAKRAAGTLSAEELRKKVSRRFDTDTPASAQ